MNKVNLFATGILLACGVTCAKAQTWTDFTEKVVNPSFETGTTAETVAGELTGSMAGELTGSMAGELTGLGWSIHDGYFSIPFRVS